MNDALNSVIVIAGDAPPGGGNGQPTGEEPGLGDMIWSMAPIIIIVVLFFWMMNRSQKKRQKEREDMLSTLKVKDDVITIGGIHGRIVEMDDETVTLRVDPDKDIKLTFVRNAISGRQGEQEEE
jgi:preprotein translocase subunit YajC